jgi:nucleoside recognition membrane protein YjiH
VLVSRFHFARKFSAQSIGSTFQRLAIQSWRGQGDLGKQILHSKYVPFSSCQTTLKNQKKNRGIRKLFFICFTSVETCSTTVRISTERLIALFGKYRKYSFTKKRTDEAASIISRFVLMHC